MMSAPPRGRFCARPTGTSARRRCAGVAALVGSLLPACSTSPPRELEVEHGTASIARPALAPAPEPDGDGVVPSAACDFTGIENAPSSPRREGAYAIGDFLLELGADGDLRARHRSDTSRVVASTPSGGSFVAASRSTLRVSDRQGSFTFEERVSTTCSKAHVDGVVADEGRLVARGHFTDDDGGCAELAFELRFCAARSGHLAFEARTSDPSFGALTVSLASEPSERIWGLGEQFPHDGLNLKGRRFPIVAQEGGIGRGHTPISQAVNAVSPGSAGTEESTYYAVPHVLTSTGRSFFLENTEVAFFDTTRADRIDARVYASAVRGRILHGRTPLELVERFTEYAGRMPPLPDWTGDGAIVALARSLDESRGLVEKLRARGTALAGVWNQTWSGKARTYIGEQVLWNWVQDPNTHPGWNEYVRWLDERGIKTLCYVNPMFRDVPPEAGPVARNLFREALAAGHLVRNAEGGPLLLKITAFEVGLLDLTSEPARVWMKDVLKTELVKNAGCRGWMADFAEALPFDARLASGVDAARHHNAYPVEWARLNREALEEAGLLGQALVFHRSGHTTTPRHGLLVWEGDQLTTWDKYDGLANALGGLVGAGFSGISLVHSDTGGYTSLSAGGVGYKRERELLHRWIEMNAFTALLRTHEGNQPDQGAQVYDDATLDQIARFSRVFRALKPYRQALFAEAATKGWPVVRHLTMHYPDDAAALDVDDEFLLGSEILVAPIKNKCWTPPFCPYDKDVYLPRGRWVHLWTGAVYGSETAGVRIRVKAPVGKPAVFHREGSAAGATFVANLRAEGVLP